MRRYYSPIMASERIQRRIERLLDQTEQEADQQDRQLARDLANEVLGLAPDNGTPRASYLRVAGSHSSGAGYEG